MSQKPETLLWKRLKEKIPSNWYTVRIENRFGGGVPDVYACAESVPFWIELKTTKTNRVLVSSHQIAWHYANHRAGGVSFFLVSPLFSSNLYLFDGANGQLLLDHGLAANGSGTVVPCAWSGDDYSGLFDHMLESGRGRVGVSGSGTVHH